jgi:hypothetical protein
MDLFYSPVDDGRTEIGRDDREALAGIICAACPYRVQCLEQALVTGEDFGVWGGLGEGERRRFKEHLIQEGYDRGEYPSGRELKSAVRTFYDYMPTSDEKLHGELEVAS